MRTQSKSQSVKTVPVGFELAEQGESFLHGPRARGNGLSFPGPPRLCTRRLPRLLEDARANKGP
ncbi:conserved hypothetical protein [Ricinus communis]|uniref:Uncharacterized protein n=1 Tax=Ricinus communis TaxID=3988 RepID=B9RRJ6_RICCO|nr:conserved hypothetical protein [Ricinus communis]